MNTSSFYWKPSSMETLVSKHKKQFMRFLPYLRVDFRRCSSGCSYNLCVCVCFFLLGCFPVTKCDKLRRDGWWNIGGCHVSSRYLVTWGDIYLPTLACPAPQMVKICGTLLVSEGIPLPLGKHEGTKFARNFMCIFLLLPFPAMFAFCWIRWRGVFVGNMKCYQVPKNFNKGKPHHYSIMKFCDPGGQPLNRDEMSSEPIIVLLNDLST